PPLDWVCTSGQRCNSIVKEDPFLCNCQCAMPPDQRYGHHIEFVIDPKKRQISWRFSNFFNILVMSLWKS
ncbi:MAG: hypothetical protein J6O73_15430, partial [Lachnospiraceae bacterium]|nr:hypothetical protein [Lachnospiraceae bacterium]